MRRKPDKAKDKLTHCVAMLQNVFLVTGLPQSTKTSRVHWLWHHDNVYVSSPSWQNLISKTPVPLHLAQTVLSLPGLYRLSVRVSLRVLPGHQLSPHWRAGHQLQPSWSAQRAATASSPFQQKPRKRWALPAELRANKVVALSNWSVLISSHFCFGQCCYCPLRQKVASKPRVQCGSRPCCPCTPCPATLQTDESRPDRLVPDDSHQAWQFIHHRPPWPPDRFLLCTIASSNLILQVQAP